jgi:hypothetical protein
MKISTTPGKQGTLSKTMAGVLLGALLIGWTGCATNRQQTMGTPEPSGFLGDYSLLQPGLSDRANLYYENYAVNWPKYTKVWIKPVELWNSGDPDSPMAGISPADQQKLIDLAHTALYNALSTNYTIVNHGGPDVLIVHMAITDARKSRPVAGFVSSVYLPLKLVSLGKQSLLGTAIGVGSITIEGELLDGATNVRLIAIVDSRSGTSALRSKFDGTWGDVEQSLDWWAARLATRLQEERADSNPQTEL